MMNGQQLGVHECPPQDIAAYSINLKPSPTNLIDREHLAIMGEFTAMIVHEVRNPLTTIQMGLRHAQKVLQSEADQQRLSLALSESHRLNRLLGEILNYTKPHALQLLSLNINEFLSDLLPQIQDLPEATQRQIRYVKDSPEVEVLADIDKLKQVFLNLFRNALEAIAPHETVSCSIHNAINSDHVCIRVCNGGKPISSELLPQITTPFCSTKSSGTGLGLAISKRIITAHGGNLEITSSISGTTVSIHLPILSCIVSS
jgi:signal transduction histidine kinase